MRKLLTGLGLLATALLLDPRASTGEPRFSRSEWIEAHELHNRFDGGALPAGTRPATAARRAPAFEGAAATVKVINVQVSKDLVAGSGGSQRETQAEPFLAIDPANEKRLLAGYQEGRYAEGGARALGAAVSTNGGLKWKAGLIPTLTEATGGRWQRASDPWVAFGPDRRAYYVSLAFDETRPDNAVVVSTSTNGGASWGDPVTVHSPGGRDFDDKEAIVVDTYADSPFRGRVYVVWDMVRDLPNPVPQGQPVLVSWSADGGASFSPTVTVHDAINLGAFPLVAPGGVLHVFWTEFSSGNRIRLLTARSTDGGETWTAALPIDDMFPSGVDGMRVGDGIAAAAVDRRNGALYVVWEDARRTGNVDEVLLS
ncbi:MAG TPA: sialidase family protein, partial [Thermoanaerobaculia bacterium]|nr:sialidase family protein [Thermoanaerobaculia bacterium]